jgi:uncharacterized protein (DUF1015 family)
VVDLRPFRALRYPVRDLTRLSAPPYDVIDPEERRALCAAHPHNVVRLLLPEPDGAQPDPYTSAADLLEAWRREGVLVPDDRARLYGYRMEHVDASGHLRTTTGLLGALSLPERLGSDGLVPHERTLPKARQDRLALLRATRANLDPIWCLADEPAASALLALTARDGAVLAEASDPSGARHTMWALEGDDAAAGVSAALRSARLVVADGHHRLETALTWRDELGGPGGAPAGAQAVLAFVTPLHPAHLAVEPIHRLLTGTPPGHDWAGALSGICEVTEVGPPEAGGAAALAAALDPGELGVVTARCLMRARVRPEPAALVRAVLPPALAGVGSVLFDELVRPLLGAGVTVAYRPDAAAVTRLVAAGAAEVAFLCPPLGVEAIRDAAAAGVRMPEKTSYFAPKPRSGFVVRPADA